MACTVRQQGHTSRTRMHSLIITKASFIGDSRSSRFNAPTVPMLYSSFSFIGVTAALLSSQQTDLNVYVYSMSKIAEVILACAPNCRYNLKRKIANMPPVTREWFEARKETIAASASAPIAKIWADPLTKKKFGSENTYKAFVNSNKYKDLVKQSGRSAPQPMISMRRALPAGWTLAFIRMVVLISCAQSISCHVSAHC